MWDMRFLGRWSDHFSPEDGGNMFLRNVSIYIQNTRPHNPGEKHRDWTSLYAVSSRILDPKQPSILILNHTNNWSPFTSPTLQRQYS
jgi:hypothetical protein